MTTNPEGYMKNYYQKNKDKFLINITCECGCVIRKQNKKYHNGTVRHRLIMEALQKSNTD